MYPLTICNGVPRSWLMSAIRRFRCLSASANCDDIWIKVSASCPNSSRAVSSLTGLRMPRANNKPNTTASKIPSALAITSASVMRRR